ncbi:MAG TPA: Hsp20/alpha crystallin family protein [Solirubrobacterales bacterium]|nr:Hsp20/alpha crystallin family protein [Solirubrobacterales bacterium]
MALVRWEPAREVDSLQSEVNRVFDAFFGNGASRTRRWVPAMDLVETDSDLVLRADLPGLTRDDVEIEIKDGTLTVSGERKSQHEEKSEGYYRVERAFGRFSRSLTLPDGIDAESVAAEFAEGVLEVRIPKPAERKPHRVAIGAASVDGSASETTEE